jgi:hypothetical protein
MRARTQIGCTALFLFVGVLTLFAGIYAAFKWNPAQTKSDIFIDRQQIDARVENGSAFEKATLVIEGKDPYVFPHDAVIEEGDIPGTIEIYMQKRLDYAGHAGKGNPMSIREERKKMGCAYRAKDGKQAIATYGEWSSKEGGAYIKLRIVVPRTLHYETRKGLSGPEYPIGTREARSREPIRPGTSGWTEIPSVPDPR